VIRKEMKGFGNEEKEIINVIENRKNRKRIEIEVKFKKI
jgi:hypothetical protein